MIKESSEHYKPMDDEEESYKQELGLKKMLYKYEHQNEQLKSQIKALTERLAQIISKKDESPIEQKKVVEGADEYRLNLLRQEMKRLYAQIERMNMEIKHNREQINQYQELRCVQLENKIKGEVKQIEFYKQKMEKFQKMQQMKGFSIQSLDLKNSSLRINTHVQKLKSIEHELELTKKNVRELELTRDQLDRIEGKRHSYVVSLNNQTRKIESLKKQHKEVKISEEPNSKSIWGMDYNEDNYMKIKAELAELKMEKDKILENLRMEHNKLKKRFSQLSVQSQKLNKSIHLPQIENPKTDRYVSSKIQNDKSLLSKTIQHSRAVSPPKLLNVGPKQFQMNNDKNFSPKKLRKGEWESNQHRTSGIQWNDAHLRSPITGINFWFDGYLVGIQFLHRLGESSQHLHLTSKVISPVQYRLNGNDYLEGVALWISDNKIAGIELVSKSGRKDGFGNRGKGRKFDFFIKDGEKPVFSYGKFRINNNTSEITKLGFEII